MSFVRFMHLMRLSCSCRRLMPVDDACDASSVASSTSSVATEHSGGEQNYVGGKELLVDAYD